MSGLFPNPSADPEVFGVGDRVKWFVNENEISPYVGVVTEICPSINKLWVEFPIGGKQQKDPTELILVTKFMGEPTVKDESGYSSYDTQISKKEYGSLKDKKVSELAKKVLKDKREKDAAGQSKVGLASKIAKDFATEVVEKVAADVAACIKNGYSDVKTYQELYPKYESICSDHFMRNAIEKIYDIKKA